MRGLRLLGWQEALPRSLAAVLDTWPTQTTRRPEGTKISFATDSVRSWMCEKRFLGATPPASR